jgi:hypothetical protein
MRDFLTAVPLVVATQLFTHYSHESDFFVGLAPAFISVVLTA